MLDNWADQIFVGCGVTVLWNRFNHGAVISPLQRSELIIVLERFLQLITFVIDFLNSTWELLQSIDWVYLCLSGWLIDHTDNTIDIRIELFQFIGDLGDIEFKFLNTCFQRLVSFLAFGDEGVLLVWYDPQRFDLSFKLL